MQKLDAWKLADRLNVYQIVLLMAGYDPSEFVTTHYNNWNDEVKKKVAPFLTAIQNRVVMDNLRCDIVWAENYNRQEVDWDNSLIEVDDIKEWLQSRNFVDGFFVGGEQEKLPLADKTHRYYAPKLAAAVRAWTEVTSDPKALNGKTPRKALEIWLRKHASEYSLTKPDGNPNEQGIEEISKVANWNPKGGASPTPVLSPEPAEAKPQTGGRVKPNPPTPSPVSDDSGEIPF